MYIYYRYVNCCALTHFKENQLALDSSGNPIGGRQLPFPDRIFRLKAFLIYLFILFLKESKISFMGPLSNECFQGAVDVDLELMSHGWLLEQTLDLRDIYLEKN